MKYICTPYSPPQCISTYEARNAWRDAAYRLAVNLQTHINFDLEIRAISPIIQWHQIAAYYELPKDAAAFELWNNDLLRRCDGIYIPNVDWLTYSIGVRHEINFALECHIQIHTIWDVPERIDAEWSSHVRNWFPSTSKFTSLSELSNWKTWPPLEPFDMWDDVG